MSHEVRTSVHWPLWRGGGHGKGEEDMVVARIQVEMHARRGTWILGGKRIKQLESWGISSDTTKDPQASTEPVTRWKLRGCPTQTSTPEERPRRELAIEVVV